MTLRAPRPGLLRAAILVAVIVIGAWFGASRARTRFAPSARMAAVFSESNLFKRLRAGIECIEGQGPAGCADIAMLLDRNDTAARLGAPELFRAVLYRWGQCDPHGALGFLRQTRQTDDLTVSHGAVLHGWLDTNPRVALDWCRAHLLPEFPAETRTMYRLERRWRTLAEFNIDAARRCIVAGTPFTDFRGVSPFLEVRQSPDAIPWLDGERRNGFVLAWGESDPFAAYRWLIQTHNMAGPQNEVIPRLLRRWFRDEPARVADLVVYENGENRWLGGFQDGFALWVGRDPEGVVAWIRKLPDQIADDSFKMRRAIDIADMNPDAAIEIAFEIKDPDFRNEIVEDCVSHCQKRFPTHFADFIKKYESRLPAPIKSRFKR